MPFRTKERYNFCIVEEPISQQKAFNNAFRHYKNYYFHTITDTLSSDSFGLAELSKCPFNHPIEDEAATTKLAVLLDLESTTTGLGSMTPGMREFLARSYRAHHVFLRGVKKFYQSKFLRKNAYYSQLTNTLNRIDLEDKVPLHGTLLEDYKEANPTAKTYTHIVYEEQETSLQWQMKNPTMASWSQWPATVFDLNFFLERANFSIPLRDIHYGEIRACTESVAKEVGLFKQIQTVQPAALPHWKELEQAPSHWKGLEQVAHWSSKDTEKLLTPIIHTYKYSHETQQIIRRPDEIASLNAQNEAFSRLALDDETVSSSPNYFQGVVPGPSPGSLSISRNNGAFGNESLWVVSLFLFGYFYQKISDVFKKSTNTKKDFVRKCTELKNFKR